MRVNDIFKQNWNNRLAESSRADFYRCYKRNFVQSSYLDAIQIKSHRVALTRLFTSSHRLRVESGRWERPTPPARHERLCRYCRKLDDEYHFVIECQLLHEIRSKLIPKYYWERPSMFKFLSLINTDNKKDLIRLAEFTKKGFDIRRNHVLFPDAICILSYLNIPHSVWHWIIEVLWAVKCRHWSRKWLGAYLAPCHFLYRVDLQPTRYSCIVHHMHYLLSVVRYILKYSYYVSPSPLWNYQLEPDWRRLAKRDFSDQAPTLSIHIGDGDIAY